MMRQQSFRGRMITGLLGLGLLGLFNPATIQAAEPQSASAAVTGAYKGGAEINRVVFPTKTGAVPAQASAKKTKDLSMRMVRVVGPRNNIFIVTYPDEG